MNVIFWGKRVFLSLRTLRSNHTRVRVGPKSNEHVLIKELWDTQRDWSYAATSERMPRANRCTERGKERLFQRLWRKSGPADTLILRLLDSGTVRE